MAEDDHDKYRPDADDGGEGDDGRSEPGSRDRARDREREEYVHTPAVDVETLEAEGESDESAADAGAAVDRDAPGDDDSSADSKDPDDAGAEVEWTGRVETAAGVETPVPRNLVASIVAVFLVLGGAMALLGLLFAGLGRNAGPVVLETWNETRAILSPSAILYAVPAQAGVIAVFAGFYAGTREEGTEAIVAAALGTFIGVVLETLLVTVFVSASVNMKVNYGKLAFTALGLGGAMVLVAAGCALLYDRFITHPDGLLGRLSDRLAPEERRGAASRSRK